jgi:hypothetical protein
MAGSHMPEIRALADEIQAVVDGIFDAECKFGVVVK